VLAYLLWGFVLLAECGFLPAPGPPGQSSSATPYRRDRHFSARTGSDHANDLRPSALSRQALVVAGVSGPTGARAGVAWSIAGPAVAQSIPLLFQSLTRSHLGYCWAAFQSTISKLRCKRLEGEPSRCPRPLDDPPASMIDLCPEENAGECTKVSKMSKMSKMSKVSKLSKRTYV
jgi:hypothetical protein